MAKMTVSQALRAVSDLKRKLKSHKEHAQSSVLYFEKDKPAFEFKTEMEGYETTRTELLRLQTGIAVANATTHIEWHGKKVLVGWAVRYLEELKGHIAWVESLSTAPDAKKQEDNYVNRYVNGQVASVPDPRTRICDLPEAAQFTMKENLQSEFNTLNGLVETSNHHTFIPEV